MTKDMKTQLWYECLLSTLIVIFISAITILTVFKFRLLLRSAV